jgi:hypothetical protein
MVADVASLFHHSPFTGANYEKVGLSGWFTRAFRPGSNMTGFQPCERVVLFRAFRGLDMLKRKAMMRH